MSDIRMSMGADVWAIEPRALEALAAALAPSAARPPMLAGREASAMSVKDGVAEIPVRGVLMRGRSDPWLSMFGIAHTGYEDIASQLEQASADPAVKAITLAVDSPGGTTAGLSRAAEAITAAGKAKPVTARVETMAASAAYWLASQAGRITAESDAIVGSIGVYSTVTDLSKAADMEGIKVHVLRSGPHKGTGVPGSPVTEAQLEPLQALVDDLASSFVSAVARGRRMSEDAVRAVATGASWVGTRAHALGLVDEIGRGSAASKTKEVRMSAQNAEPHAAPEKKAATLAELKAEFGKRPQFVIEQLEVGATIEQARMAHLKVERDEMAAEIATLKAAAAAPPKPAAPSKAVPSGPAADASDEPADFVAAAREYAETHKTSVRKAMSALAARDPDSHREYVAALPRVRRSKK